MTKVRSRRDEAIDRSRDDWYKDAIVYQLHVKAFQDSNDDGIGDFAGLMRRLDHVQALGATAVWLLPFYPSPLRDDGYDIADYRAINPSYGSMGDFKSFVAEAHRRGLRVITELVINHTSDQHPWFQRARRARPGSSARNFYVWSDTDEKFPETRIIFTDTEKSNWSWDPEANAYYWHRFYSHQPDLNFDNPRVLREVLRTMHFWLAMGVDGLRLDAIPYLVEREGTNNENLPETHEVLKKIRAELDAYYPDRMLLAEANQWPEDTRPYFGEGDECHMGFHFPLMPRMYMAVAQEDRHPITDIVRQTPDIPENCQWAIFLRNHDELTLEMVTDRERDYLWHTYAQDMRARINLGIRRRLAPLMQNDRRKIELMNSMLLSMPGTPILYYGDEIGMGDNYYLGDRDGVRTPMQWSLDRNAGFSRANPQQLYLPVILDPIFGYQATNVESQDSDPSSLLNWMRRMVAVRKQHPAFGRGTMTLLYPSNRKMLAYAREHDGETILCVVNLSRAAQAVELDLAQWKGMVPVELIGRSAFPPIGELPYLVTIPAYGFYWFVLTDKENAPSWHSAVPEILPEFMTLTTRDGRVSTALAGREGQQLDAEVLPKFLPLQRWFAAKDQKLQTVALSQLAEFDDGQHVLAVAEAALGTETQRYFLPLSALWGEENLAFGAPKLSYTIAKLRRGSKTGALIDGVYDERFAAAVVEHMRVGSVMHTGEGEVVFEAGSRLGEYTDLAEPQPLSGEQSNTSIAFGDKLILKIYRRLRCGVQPDIEMARFLTEQANFANTPAYLGSVEHRQDDEPTVLAAAFAFVRNQGDAWRLLTGALQRDVEEYAIRAGTEAEEAADEPPFYYPLDSGALLGRRTAELHRALCIETDDPAFKVEPTRRHDVSRWVADAVRELAVMLDRLLEMRTALPEPVRETADKVIAGRRQLERRLRAVEKMEPSGGRSRIHGDYHLGQVLVAQNDVMIIDFEGEPRRSLEERREKSSPLRDVAGMLRSLDYAAFAALGAATEDGAPPAEAMRRRAGRWLDFAGGEFLEAYREHAADNATHPSGQAFADALLDMFVIQKAVYEVAYELANRPAWVAIPLNGLLGYLDEDAS